MKEKIISVIRDASERRILRKIVFSRPSDKDELRTVASLFSSKNGTEMQFESFMRDGKALHRNLGPDAGIEECASMSLEKYGQTDIITTAGNCTVMVSKSGNAHIKNGIKSGGETAALRSFDGDKTRVLDKPSALPFLIKLGICGDDGRVFDRRRAKYRQINRFLELVGDIYDRLPAEGTLNVCDLCCGKSYLTFAVYWYLTAEKGRNVVMYGVDLKGDVIEYCSSCASELGYDGMHFICGNALEFTPPCTLDLMISLHACDIATDIVLAGAVKNGTRIIMSTPCCHHEMFGQMKSDALSFITDYPILKQKLCDAATDSLRALRLEAENYSVTAMELIDPDETPKNVLIRAILRDRPLSEAKRDAVMEKYRAACALLGAEPYLDKLLK